MVCDKSPCTLLWRCDAWIVKVSNFDKSPGTKLETVTMFLLNRTTLVLLVYFEKRRWNELSAQFSEQLEQGWCVQGVHKCASLNKGQFIRNDLGTSKSWKCVQGWQAPHEAVKKNQYWRVKSCMQCLRNHDDAHGHFWANTFCARRTCISDRKCLLKDDSGWQIEWGFGHKINTKLCMQLACWNVLLLCWANVRARKSGWHPAAQMCTELLIQLMSLSLKRILTGKTKW
jgi:hypothetical protein